MDYSLNTPIKRQLYIPDDVPFAPVFQPKPPAETDQTHRKMTWLFHKPQDHVVFPTKPESARDKKK